MTKPGRLVCPDCGTGLVPTMKGLRCPRLGSCGRGGIEETGDALRGASPAGERDSPTRAY
ncbi:MAG: hypothetical protein ACYDCK_05215 [Thermoplasmatota archaeon]